MPIFANKGQLINFARKFINERSRALQKDVNHCLYEPYAPFPAILYCFSIIDLLGALYAGNATKDHPATKQSMDYMQQLMGYTKDQTHLLMGIFRHKIVHLAQPKTIIEYKGQLIGWRYWHDNSTQHLQLNKLPRTVAIQRGLPWQQWADHEFGISIAHLVKDIRASARRYLSLLQGNPTLRNHFEKAISEIYNPKV